jgi:hypothetical protein
VAGVPDLQPAGAVMTTTAQRPRPAAGWGSVCGGKRAAGGGHGVARPAPAAPPPAKSQPLAPAPGSASADALAGYVPSNVLAALKPEAEEEDNYDDLDDD